MSGLLGPAVMMNIGGGLLNTPITTTVTAGVNNRDAGAVSGLMNTAKQSRRSLGVAMMTVVAGRHVATPAGAAAGHDCVFVAYAVVLVAVAALAGLLPGRRDVI